MASRTGKERGSVSVEESSPEVSRPDPEVPERAKRRYFSAQYKLRVLEEADACRAARTSSPRVHRRDGVPGIAAKDGPGLCFRPPEAKP